MNVSTAEQRGQSINLHFFEAKKRLEEIIRVQFVVIHVFSEERYVNYFIPSLFLLPSEKKRVATDSVVLVPGMGLSRWGRFWQLG